MVRRACSDRADTDTCYLCCNNILWKYNKRTDPKCTAQYVYYVFQFSQQPLDTGMVTVPSKESA